MLLIVFYFRFNSASSLLRGALTHRSSEFRNRPWELRRVYSIDFLDSLNTAIELNLQGSVFIRILPRVTSFVSTNNEWISDRVRYSIDAFRLQRVDTPFIRLKRRGLWAFSWKTIFNSLFVFHPLSVFTLFNNFQLTATKQFSTAYLNFFSNGGVPFGISSFFWIDRLYDLFSYNRSILGSDSGIALFPWSQFNARSLLTETGVGLQLNFQTYSSIYIVGSEIAVSHPVLWSFVHQQASALGLKLYSFSDAQPTKFSKVLKGFQHLGSLSLFKKFVDGRHWQSSSTSTRGCRALVLFVINRIAEFPLLHYAQNVSKMHGGSYTVFPLFTTNSTIHSSLFGLTNSAPADISLRSNNNLVYLNNSFSITKGLGQSRLAERKANSFSSTFAFNVTSHASELSQTSKILLPVSAFFETVETAQSLLGNRQSSSSAIGAPGLSVTPSRLFVLLYSLVLKTLSSFLRRQFHNYLLNFLVNWFLNKNQLKSRISFLKENIIASLRGDLSLTTFLHSVEQDLILYTAIPKIAFDVVEQPITCLFAFQSIRFHQNTASELISDAYLRFNDEITMHSKTLLKVQQRLI